MIASSLPAIPPAGDGGNETEDREVAAHPRQRLAGLDGIVQVLHQERQGEAQDQAAPACFGGCTGRLGSDRRRRHAGRTQDQGPARDIAHLQLQIVDLDPVVGLLVLQRRPLHIGGAQDSCNASGRRGRRAESIDLVLEVGDLGLELVDDRLDVVQGIRSPLRNVGVHVRRSLTLPPTGDRCFSC